MQLGKKSFIVFTTWVTLLGASQLNAEHRVAQTSCNDSEGWVHEPTMSCQDYLTEFGSYDNACVAALGQLCPLYAPRDGAYCQGTSLYCYWGL